MRWTGSCVAALVAATWFVAAPPARAQAEKEALQALPDNTLAFVAVNRLNQLDEKIAKLAKQFKAPIPGRPLMLVRGLTGIDKGLDDKGTLIAAALQIGDATAEPAVLVFVPVTDYKEFITQLNAKNPDAEVTEITIPLVNQELVVGKRGKFAVAAKPKDREALLAALTSKKGMPVSAALQAYVAQNDAAGVVTTRGVQVASDLGRKGLDQFRGQLDNLPLPPDAAQVMTVMMDGASRFLKSVETDVANVGVGLHVDAGGNLHVDARALFVKGSGFAKAGAEASKPPPGGHLAGLPAGAFALAMGGSMSEKTAEALLKFNLELIKMGAKELPAERIKKLEEAYIGMMKGFRGASLVVQVGKGNEPLMSTMIGVFQTANAEAYLAHYDKSIQEVNELFKGLPIPFPPMESKKIKIDGKPGLEISMDFSGLPGIDEAKKLLEQILGEGGKMTVSMAAVNDKTIAVRYAGTAKLKETLQALKTGGGLASDAQIVKTAAMLPEGAQWAVYINPKGAIDLANRALKMFEAPQQLPAFPPTPPIGVAVKFSEAGLQIHAAVPAAFLNALAQYIPKVKNLNLQ